MTSKFARGAVVLLMTGVCHAPMLVQTAAAQDDQSEEDVLAMSSSFDVIELIEDELLMELPVAPRHEVCPDPVKTVAADPEFGQDTVQRQNPFALLEKLKTNKK